MYELKRSGDIKISLAVIVLLIVCVPTVFAVIYTNWPLS